MSQSGLRVAVVDDGGDDRDGRRLRAAIEDDGGRLSDPSDADAVVTVGERALVEAAIGESGPGGSEPAVDRPPILPVGSGRYAVARPSASDAIRQLLSGAGRSVEHPLLSVSLDGDRVGRAVFDVAIVTDEPARISEYRAAFPSEHEASVRSDAIVVATPLGSDGYAGAAGGPTIDPGAGLSVVPVAPFTTGAETWVADGAVTLSVERDEEPVSLVVDDERRERVPPHEPVRVTAHERMELLSVPATRGDW
ncbi:ATP-NAD kinase [Halorubrum sp. DTA98]|uniref:ATP-NAD kinase n=1 Tax=Halorubrum sp. DTA98 TaxID=3402163 RepID=UPI003AAE3151